jgi:CheY-like chemotaxis protein
MTKILLVEDDKSLREIYGVRLLAEGYDIVTAGDGEEALAMAIKERPQLIVSDVMMPKISGFDMLDILRSTSETKNIKVIMMTALSSEDQRARGEALGADRYLVKSQVGIEDVVRTVHEVLGDAPVSASTQPTPQQTFGGPGQTNIGARPAPTVSPGQRPEAPAPARIPQPPVTPPEPLAPTPPAQPSVPAPQPNQATSGLPQPTAPFSTNRPAGLGDRIIHPLSQPESSNEDIAQRMQQELDSHPAAPVAPQPPTPNSVEPLQAPQPVQQPQSASVTPPADEPYATDNSTTQNTEQETTPTPQPQPQPSSRPEDHGINYEETPRTPTPPQPPLPPMPGTPTGA